MPRLRFPCTIKNGILTISNRTEFDNTIADLNGEYYIELKETGVRSSQQNNYYWQIVGILADELGYTEREMHNTIKNHFEIQSTKTLSTKEFSKFVEKLIRWSAIELNIVIPDP
tara:strand:- start:110 stop:451 length:342 start_codon:yes stop_codon:yes gene_type:complete